MTEILSDEAVAFVADLHRRFAPRRNELLSRRAQRRAEVARTGRLDFLPETAEIRAGDSYAVPAGVAYAVEVTEMAEVVEAVAPGDAG